MYELKDEDLKEEIKKGDVVYLNSNPDISMTVSYTDSIDADCVWIDVFGRVKRDSFRIECLSKRR